MVLVFGGGIVHFFFLRPLLDLDGADLLADRLLLALFGLAGLVDRYQMRTR